MCAAFCVALRATVSDFTDASSASYCMALAFTRDHLPSTTSAPLRLGVPGTCCFPNGPLPLLIRLRLLAVLAPSSRIPVPALWPQTR